MTIKINIGKSAKATSLTFNNKTSNKFSINSGVVKIILLVLEELPVPLKNKDNIATINIGPTEQSPIKPNESSSAFSLERALDTPSPKAIINGTVIGPVVTPPASKAIEEYPFLVDAIYTIIKVIA